MLRSQSRATVMRTYLSATQLCPEASSGMPAVEAELSAVDKCTHWLEQNRLELSSYKPHVEIGGDLTVLFCMAFSPAMETPAAVRRIASGYIRHALGEAAPDNCLVVEPLMYGQPVIILGLDSSVSSLAASKQLYGVEPYAIAVWNRLYATLEERCWLAVVEPTVVTLLYKQGAHIQDIVVRPLVCTSTVVQLMHTLIRQQFHRPADTCYFSDEFRLVSAEAELGALERVGSNLPVFPWITDELV